MLATCTASKTSMMMVSHYHNAEHAVRRLCFALTRRVYHRYNQHGRSSLWVGHVICSDSTTNTKYVWTILPFQALDSHCKTRNTYCTVIPKSALKGRLRLSSASNFMTQVQTIGGLKQRRGRGRGRGTGRGRGGRSRRNDKPEPFRPFKGPAKSLSVDSSQQPPAVSHGSGVFATEQQHLAGVAKLQQQHDEAIALRAVQMAELQKQQQAQQAQACFSSRSEALGTSAPSQPPATSSAERDIIDLCDDTGQPPHQALGVPARPPAKPREQISWSLGVGHATSDSSVPSGSSNGDNPFWAPARYMPVGGETQADLRLQTQEVVQVLDSGLVGHRGTAILDTGNAGCTLITKSFARQLGLIDMHGNPTQAYSQTIRVQGVVAGAVEMIKTLNITYEIKGKKMHIMAGLTEARLGCDLLISRREIAEFESDGYRLSAR